MGSENRARAGRPRLPTPYWVVTRSIGLRLPVRGSVRRDLSVAQTWGI